jgi:1,4-alpha-glucan branching enzyme
MTRGYVALVVELHHPLPGPGRAVGRDWALAAVETYWPLLRALEAAADSGRAEALTVAVSPSWSALASDPDAQALTRAELHRRLAEAPHERNPWHALRQYVEERWRSDPLGPLRRAGESGAVEVIPTTASHAWLPALADVPVVARAQVNLVADDHLARFGSRPAGIWLPHLSYLPGLERTIAGVGIRYFGVEADAFRRGTVRPPADILGPLVTPPGAAAFGVDPNPSAPWVERARRADLDPRLADPARAAEAIGDDVGRFLHAWLEPLGRVPQAGAHPPISVAAISAHHLPHTPLWPGEWLMQLLHRMAELAPWSATTPGRYLDRYPEGPVGRPGPSAGGVQSVRPAGSDLIDRCRSAAEILADAVEHRQALDPFGHRALAQMTRALLTAQSLDWEIPPGLGLGVEAGMARAERCLAQFQELAGSLLIGRVDPARLAALEAGPAYLPKLDLDRLAAL